MGILNEDKEVVLSPYICIDLIFLKDLHQTTSDILQFSARYTREADDVNGENIYWAYCRESNVPLLPTFLLHSLMPLLNITTIQQN